MSTFHIKNHLKAWLVRVLSNSTIWTPLFNVTENKVDEKLSRNVNCVSKAYIPEQD